MRTWTSKVAEQDPRALIKDSRSMREVQQATTYFDGLGRPIQTVVKKGALNGTDSVDLVSPIEYDEFGREPKKYLPYLSFPANGLYKTDPFTEQNSFYTGGQSPVAGQGESFFYSKTNFELSPLSRPVDVYAPGLNWAGSEGTSTPHAVKTAYWINTATDAVRIWNVADVSGGFGSYTNPSGSTYAAGQLYKTVSEDERGMQVIEFKDKEGQVILKKLQVEATVAGQPNKDNGTGSGFTGWLNTYYIYDDLGRLRAVLPPKAVDWLVQNNWPGLGTDVLNELCFRYEYDGRSRMIMKKVPGAAAVQMVYDSRDRLVMVQDGLHRQGKYWLTTEYENGLNRPRFTYKMYDPNVTDVDGLNQANADAFRADALATPISTLQPSIPQNQQYYTRELLTETRYDDYNYLPSPFSANLINTGFSTSFDATDNDHPDRLSQTTLVRGQVTWTRTKVLGEDKYIATCNLYDEKSRLLQTQTTNYTRAMDILTNQYSFSGQLLRSHVKHQKDVPITQTYIVATRNSYDDLGRLTAVEKSLNGAAWKRISGLSYDGIGQLKTRLLSPGFGGNTALESLSYDYNIRGWLLGVNRGYAKTASSSTNYFGFDLGYDKPSLGSLGNYSAAQFNGNIGGTLWRSRGDGEIRKYDFTYDGVNRLLTADFNQFTGGTFNRNAGLNFSVDNLAYDANGNIQSMRQYGWKAGASAFTPIDNLTYSYFGNSNKLQAVSDAIAADNHLGDFTDKNTGATDYGYDVNGNLVTDLNKRINGATGIDQVSGGAIVYNHLNLPTSIAVKNDDGTDKGNIGYVYDAMGNKLKKIIHEAGKPDKITLYLFGTYQEGQLQFLPQEEGRIRLRASDNTFQWDYFLKDHLGNVRMVLTEETQTNYYPAATLEGSQATGALSMLNWEKQFYTVDNARITPTSSIPGWSTSLDYANNNGNPPYNSIASGSYPANYTVTDAATSAGMYKTNATSNKTALAQVIKVMAGDRVDIFGKSYYYAPGTSFTDGNSISLIVSDILSAFLGTTGNPASQKGLTEPIIESLNSGSYALPANLMRGADGTTSTTPKAYINYIFFDEQFRYAGSGFSQVGSSGTVKSHWSDASLQNIPVPKNGYLYVYVSNESNQDVFFDNLQVVHKRGPVLEETHYYPFGLTMEGISSKAAGSLINRYKFNNGTELSNQEFSDGSGLELYETPFRGYDPQIGRFWQIDVMASEYETWSPYVFSFNNPVNLNDPSGLSTDSLRAPDGEMVADKGEMEAVTVKASPKSKQNYYWWSLFANVNQNNDYWYVYNRLKNEGVNERGLRLFDLAWQGIDYRKRLAEIEAGWREFVEDALIEGGTWVVGGVAFKAVSVGFRMYKLSRAASTIRVFWNTGGRGGNELLKVAAENFARMNGGMTVNMTISGRALELVNPILPKSISTPLWNRLSSSFARNAIGEVHVFQNATVGVNAASTWVKHEFSNLNLSRVNVNFHY